MRWRFTLDKKSEEKCWSTILKLYRSLLTHKEWVDFPGDTTIVVNRAQETERRIQL